MFGVGWHALVMLLFMVLVTSSHQNYQLEVGALRGTANKRTAYVGQPLSVHSRLAH
jgi:hypothetical protein